MAKTLRGVTSIALQESRIILLRQLRVPANAMRASYVRQFLTCGKPNCRCRRGHKHGPFYYLVQCLNGGAIRKFLLKTPAQRQTARASIDAYAQFQKRMNELSDINTELLRRGECLMD